MHRAFLIITLFLSTVFSYSTYAAIDFPCVKEVCIGDRLEKLRDINWQPINYSLKRLERMRKSDRARRTKTYKGFDNDTPSYLIFREFDSDLLEDMSRVRIACEPNQLEGVFVSDAGHKTQVFVSLLPSGNSGTMTWRVTGINRIFQGLSDNDQRKQLHQDLNERYSKYFSQKVGGANVLIVQSGNQTSLSMNWNYAVYNPQNWQHPSCERPKKIILD